MSVRALLFAGLLLLLSGWLSHGRAAAAFTPDTCARLEDAASRFPGRVAYVLLDLQGSGNGCSRGRDQQFSAAPLDNVFVIAAAHQERERGTFVFSEEVGPTAVGTERAESGPRDTSGPGLTAAEATRRMVLDADASAAAALRARVGASTVAAMPVRLGLRDTNLGESPVSTAGDLAKFLELLYAGRVVNAEASREMRDLLGAMPLRDGLVAGLGADASAVQVAGRLGGVAHEAAIVTTSRGSYVLAVLTEAAGAATPGGPAPEVTRSVSAVAFAAYTGQPVRRSEHDVQPVSGVFDDLGAVVRQPQSMALLLVFGGALSVLVVWRRLRPGAPVRGNVELQGGRNPADVARHLPYTAREDTQFATAVPETVPDAVPESRRDLPMRFGSRNRDNEEQERAEPRVEARPDMRMARPTPTRPTLPPVTSARLRRIAEYFVAQQELLHEMQRQVEMETAPLAELLVRQQTTMAQTMANLEDRLRPLNEYADAEEANLAALEQRMAGAGMDFVARSFSEYLSTQRERIGETRSHIDEQRAPFLRYDEDARAVVEVALSRFDDDLSALEQNLSEQRRVMLRMLDAMRSEAFASAKELLLSREAQMEEMARTGVTDPAEIAGRLHALRSEVSSDGGNAHVQQVIAATDAADQRLSATTAGRPRPVGSRPALPAEVEAPASGDSSEATTA